MRLITRLGLLLALVLSLVSATPRPYASAAGPLPKPTSATVSDIGIYPLIASGKTDISVAVCSDAANAQFRSEQANVFLSQIYVRATGCPVRVAASWRIVVGAVPGECFMIYAWASDPPLSEGEFMGRSARYWVCVTGLGQISIVTTPTGAIDSPASGATLQGTITVSGWAIDRGSWAGTGVDAVYIYAGSTMLGSASYGQSRPDVGSAHGDSRYNDSGYTYQLDTTRLPNGPTTIQVHYHSSIFGGQWNVMSQQVVIGNATVGKVVEQPVPPPPVGWNVPYYSQSDPRWGSSTIGTCRNPKTNAPESISSVGCALTSLAMIFKFYGASHDPGTLNSCMNDHACGLWWDSPRIATCSGGKVRFDRRENTFSYVQLEQELRRRPVILELKNGGNQHFVVVVKGSGNNPANYIVNDPGIRNGARTTLSRTLAIFPGYKPSGMRLYSGTPAYTTAERQTITSAPLLERPQPTAGEVITGTVVPYRNTETKMVLELATQSNAGMIAYMRIWTDKHPSNIWQPFSPYVSVPLDGEFYAQFRDSAGNTSVVVNTRVPTAPDSIQRNISQIYLPFVKR